MRQWDGVGRGKPTQCLRLWHSFRSSWDTQCPVSELVACKLGVSFCLKGEGA